MSARDEAPGSHDAQRSTREGSIDASLEEATVIDRGGYDYVIHPLTDGVPRCEPTLLREWVDWAKARPGVGDADVLLAPEAMALPLAAALALQTSLPYLVVRKRRYDLPGETAAYCETGYGSSCLYVNGLRAGEKVVIVDDVISTGSTLDALLETLADMEVEVLRILVFLDKGGHAEDLAARHGVPVDVMRAVRIKDGRVAEVERPEATPPGTGARERRHEPPNRVDDVPDGT